MKTKRFILSFVTLCVSQPVFAGYHEFNLPPGDEALLLGGAFAAGSYDASGLYYNPAGIAKVTGKRLSGSTQGYARQKTIYDIDSVQQDGVYKITSDDLVPGVLGSVSKPEWSHDWAIGFTILTLDHLVIRQDTYMTNMTLLGSHLDQYTNRRWTETSETWVGFGAAQNWTHQVRFGWALFGVFSSTKIHNFEKLLFSKGDAGSVYDQVLITSDGMGQRTGKAALLNLGIQYELTPELSFGASISKGTVLSDENTFTFDTSSDPYDLFTSQNPSSSKGKSQNYRTEENEQIRWGQWPWRARTGFSWQVRPSTIVATDTTIIGLQRQAPIDDNLQTTANLYCGWRENWLPQWSSGLGFFTNNDRRPPVTPYSDNTESENFLGAIIAAQYQIDDTRYTLAFAEQQFFGKHKVVNTSDATSRRITQKVHTERQEVTLGISSGW